MFENDYIMRIIRDMVRFLARAFLGKDTVDYELPDEENYTQTDFLHKQLLELIEQGRINEAEDILFNEWEPGNERFMELALDFYERLNNLDDEFLEKCNFPRGEIEQGLKDITAKFGIKIPI